MAKKNKYKWIGKMAMVLGGIGALTWGTVEAFNFNIVTAIFGSIPSLVSVIYYLVGISGAIALYQAFKK